MPGLGVSSSLCTRIFFLGVVTCGRGSDFPRLDPPARSVGGLLFPLTSPLWVVRLGRRRMPLEIIPLGLPHWGGRLGRRHMHPLGCSEGRPASRLGCEVSLGRVCSAPLLFVGWAPYPCVAGRVERRLVVARLPWSCGLFFFTSLTGGGLYFFFFPL